MLATQNSISQSCILIACNCFWQSNCKPNYPIAALFKYHFLQMVGEETHTFVCHFLSSLWLSVSSLAPRTKLQQWQTATAAPTSSHDCGKQSWRKTDERLARTAQHCSDTTSSSALASESRPSPFTRVRVQ